MRVAAASPIVTRAQYHWGTWTMIETLTRPLVVHAVTAGRKPARALQGYEVRRVGLPSAGFKLGIAFGDFDSVRVANARADIRCCPVCRPQPEAHA